MQPTTTTRRQVLRTASSSALAMTAASYSRVMGANDRINLGLIGAGDRGYFVMTTFQGTNQVDVKAVCDIYSPKIDRVQTKAPGAAARPVRPYSRHRRSIPVRC